MKILFVLNQNEVGGAEKFIFDIFTHFKMSGYEVGLFFLKRGNFEFCNKESSLYKKIFYGNKFSLINPISIIRLIIISRKYDIIHVNLFPAFYLTIFVKIFSSAKLVYTEHSTSNKRRNFPILKEFDKLIYKIYDLVICINSEVKKSLLHHLRYNKNLVIIENGINLEFVKNVKKSNLSDQFPSIKKTDFILCQVSSFIEPKDQLTIVKAMKSLPNNIKLILVGDGVKRRDVEKYIINNNLSERVFILGIRSDAISIIKSSNLCVLSSGHEGLSIFCLESFASGIPIIGTNVPGLRELLEPRALFLYKSHSSFSELVLKIINDESLYTDIKNYGLSKSNQFSLEFCLKKHLSFYNKILS